MLRTLLALALLTACSAQRSTSELAVPSAVPVEIDASRLLPDQEKLATEPALRAQLRDDLHAYFRYINVPFSREVCDYFGRDLSSMPTVTLHGDAHLEQYAITDAGRGLTDFDDASKGPAVLDLVRFGVSLELGARAHGWKDAFGPAFAEFLRGYRAGLAQPDVAVPEPAAAARIRSTFVESREGFLAWASGLILPMSESEATDLSAAIAAYTEAVTSRRNDVPGDFFTLQQAGPFRLGIGSALDEKYLLRVRGLSDDPMDDVILEAKEIRSLAGVPCVSAGPKADPFRFLAGPVDVPYRPYLGTFSMHGKSFWVHAWIGNYKELGLGETLESRDGLMEIAFESGVQLARAHIEGLGAAPDPGLAERQIALVSSRELQIEAAVRSMAQATIKAWEQFRRIG